MSESRLLTTEKEMKTRTHYGGVDGLIICSISTVEGRMAEDSGLIGCLDVPKGRWRHGYLERRLIQRPWWKWDDYDVPVFVKKYT